MGRTTELRAALRSGFFSHVERQGFVRDERRQPMLTCFRRMTDAAVQVFDVHWEKYGRPRFVVNFAEAPIAGFDYLGEHIPASEAWAGHLTLARGRLAPGGGFMTGSWFRLDRPLLARLVCMRRYYDADYVVTQVLELFPEVLAWWHHKVAGPHLHIFAPEPLYRKPKAVMA